MIVVFSVIQYGFMTAVAARMRCECEGFFQVMVPCWNRRACFEAISAYFLGLFGASVLPCGRTFANEKACSSSKKCRRIEQRIHVW